MFQGSLEDGVKLPDIIQVMSASSKTGCFVLSQDSHHGKIYLEDGQIVHATTDDQQGEEAIYTLALWETGNFTFNQNEKGAARTVNKGITNILMELARRLDEWRVLKKKVPSLGLIPELDSLGHKKVSFNTQEWHVLAKINGVNSIRKIASLTNMPPMEVAKLIYGMVAGNMVHLREAPKATPDPNPLEKRETAAPKPPPQEEKQLLSRKIEKIYQYSKSHLGELAHPVVQRHCAAGVKLVQQGKGMSAVIETATQIVKAAQILEGEEKSKALTSGLKRIIKEA